jgi:hypothetical protein
MSAPFFEQTKFARLIDVRLFQRADAARFYAAFQLVLLSGAALLLAKGIARIL